MDEYIHLIGYRTDGVRRVPSLRICPYGKTFRMLLDLLNENNKDFIAGLFSPETPGIWFEKCSTKCSAGIEYSNEIDCIIRIILGSRFMYNDWRRKVFFYAIIGKIPTIEKIIIRPVIGLNYKVCRCIVKTRGNNVLRDIGQISGSGYTSFKQNMINLGFCTSDNWTLSWRAPT